ncbi:MAG TPA: hypothetical protein VFS05_15600 [Gemmatimonadaceae bacterium]|nr:hypothetical protein [Gemmatimonadaceae bacterium]
MSPARRVLAIAVALALLGALTALTRHPWAATPAGHSILRLSWRARGEEIERCRRATPAELASVPAHMRQEEICEGEHVAPYHLRLDVDGRRVLDGPVAGSGVAGDRPMYVLHDIALAPGRHRVWLRVERLGPGAKELDDEREDEPDEHRGATPDAPRRSRPRRAVPPLLALDTTMVTAANDVRLVTYDAELGRLVVLGGDSPAEGEARP